MSATLYQAAAALMRPVDVVAFWGAADDPLHPSEIVSGLIEDVTAGGPSHVAIVRQPLCDGQDVTVCESTISPGRNGVQTNPLGDVLASYLKGSRASLYRLDEETRKRVDLEAFYAACGANDGITSYSVGELFQFLLPDWIDERIEPAVLQRMACSVWVATALRACRATPDITPWKMKPSDVLALPVFAVPLPIL